MKGIKTAQILKAVHRLIEKKSVSLSICVIIGLASAAEGFVVFLLGISKISKLMLTTCLEPI